MKQFKLMCVEIYDNFMEGKIWYFNDYSCVSTNLMLREQNHLLLKN